MNRKVYLIGIGGIAMANLACLLKKQGYLVSGSDLDTFGPSAVLLKTHGIDYFKDHNPNHIKKFKPDITVIGNAIQRGNPSLEYILNKRLPYCSMPEIIKKEVIGEKISIVIAGTSGKTTTAAIIAWILHKSGLKPSALIGGIVKNLDSGFLAGSGRYAVVEGDEYGTSFYDNSPKFIHYLPYFSVITNIQADHLDIYGNMENIFKAFQKLVKITPTQGSLILNNDNPYTPELIKESKSKIVTFAKNGPRYAKGSGEASDIWKNNPRLTPDGLSIVVYRGSKRLGEVKSKLFGRHNVENILAAIALALELKIPFSKINKAIADFEGVKRRLEVIYDRNNVKIIDDFAHNPDKVSASLSALRSHFSKHHIVAIFEPRTGSSRRKFFQNAYISSFKPADMVYAAEPYRKSALNKKEAFSSWQLAKDLNKKGTEAYALKNADEILAHLKSNFLESNTSPTIFCIMTSGEFDGIHKKLVKLVS